MSPGQRDDAVVERHLLALDAAVRNLQRHAGRPLEDLEDDLDEQWIVLHGLQVCAQNVLDVATHLCASAGQDSDDYTAAIDGLARLGILPRDFATGFRAIAGFRNVVVHGYLEVDLETVHAVLNGRLDDFRAFARHVRAWQAR